MYEKVSKGWLHRVCNRNDSQKTLRCQYIHGIYWGKIHAPDANVENSKDKFLSQSKCTDKHPMSHIYHLCDFSTMNP